MFFTLEKSVLVLALAFCFCILPIYSQEEGKLKDFEKEVEKEKKEEDNPEDNNESSEESFVGDCLGNCITPEFLSDFLYYGFIYSPFLADTNFRKFGFSEYPYFDFYSGEYFFPSEKSSAFGLELSYFNETDDLTGYIIRGRGSLHQLFSIDLEISRIHEDLFRTSYSLGLYNLFLNYTRLHFEKISLRFGLGAKAVHGKKFNLGFGGTVSLEIYPIYPLSLFFNGNTGYVNSAVVSDIYTGAGFHYQRFKISAGYQMYSANDIAIKGISAGISIFF